MHKLLKAVTEEIVRNEELQMGDQCIEGELNRERREIERFIKGGILQEGEQY